MLVAVPNKDSLVPKLLAGSPVYKATPLPEWAVFFTDLGGLIASESNSHLPLTAVLALPTRTFAAVFTALGVVYKRRTLAPESQRHFEKLWVSDPGVTVRFRQGTTEHRGALSGTITRDGMRHLIITSSGTGTAYVPETMAHEIISVGVTHKRPQRTRLLRIQDPWLARMLEGCDEGEYLFHNRHDCLVVGYDSGLHEEAKLQLHLLDGPRQYISGNIECLLRIKRWQAGSKTYSSDILPYAAGQEEAGLELARRFHVVVYDGSGPYLRWNRHLGSQHHIVLLDRTEHSFSEGVVAVNNACMRRSGEFVRLPFPVPRGIETMLFRRPT